MKSNAHSVFALRYHLIMTTKYRRRVFDDVISDRAKDIFLHIARSYNISLQEWNH
ncbi:transposase, partial [[Clostridium] innocuum]|nr:transposase [[Clostridium] innocuum]